MIRMTRTCRAGTPGEVPTVGACEFFHKTQWANVIRPYVPRIHPVDWGIVHSIATTHLDDFTEFARVIGGRLDPGIPGRM